MKFDLSIGQRLAIGLVLLTLILVAVLIGVFRAHESGARAQAAFTEHIAPLTDQAFTLERSVYGVGIGARAYLLNSDPATRDEYRRALANARDVLRVLDDLPKSAIGDALYIDLAPLVYLYLLQSERMVEEGHGAINARADRALGHTRERALDAIRVFSDYHGEQARAALAGMAGARQAVTRDLTVTSVLALLFFVALAFLTAESIRRPVRELLTVARDFETGHWKSALAWAPDPEEKSSREPRNEMAQLARALGAAAAALEQREQRLHAAVHAAAAGNSSLAPQMDARAQSGPSPTLPHRS